MLGHLGSRHRKGRETAMPELPEVETVCRTLFERLLGTRIAKVRVIDGRLRQPVAADFATNLRGGIVVAISRRGKFILVKLDSGYTLVSHLGMSGKLTFREGAASVEKHDHIVFTLGDGSELRYHDTRRFGLCVVLLSRDLDAWPPFARLGMDPLDHGFNGSYLYPFLRSSRRTIRDLLLDQQIVCGLGNIYVNEVLFRIGIRPTRRCRRISRLLSGELAHQTTKLLHEAIRWRGSSVSDYRDGNDNRGSFQLRLRVYDRKGDPCHRCRTPIKRVSLGSRGVFYCPVCQR